MEEHLTKRERSHQDGVQNVRYPQEQQPEARKEHLPQKKHYPGGGEAIVRDEDANVSRYLLVWDE